MKTERTLITQLAEALMKANSMLALRGTYYDDIDEALSAAREYLAAPEQSEPKGYLHYPPKKPELAVLSFQKEPITAHKARGYISEALYTNPAPKAEPVNQALLKALQAALGWIDAVPDDVVLPAMPGFDRDDVDALVAKAEQAPQPKAEPVNQVYLDGGWHDKPAEDMWMYTEERGLQPSDIRVLYIAPQPKTELVNQALLDVLKSVIEWMDAPEDSAFSDSQLAEARAAIAAAEQAPQPAELTKPHCKECAQWRKAKADNAEWIEGVKRGREICEQLAAQGAKT